jgi:uncharacterized protein YukE
VGEKLKVDVDGLIRGGADVGEQAIVLSNLHQQSVVGLSDAESGWVGSSADALVTMADKWQQVADKHHADLTMQATHIDETARTFQATDECTASDLQLIANQAAAVS